MRPLPEVAAAAERLSALTGDLDLLRGLEVLSEVAVTLIPSIVGVSVTVVLDGEPFTVTSTSKDMAELDATQYLDDGPCVASAREATPVVADDVLDEQRWQLYREASAAKGVRASMSLPLGGAGGRTPRGDQPLRERGRRLPRQAGPARGGLPDAGRGAGRERRPVLHDA